MARKKKPNAMSAYYRFVMRPEQKERYEQAAESCDLDLAEWVRQTLDQESNAVLNPQLRLRVDGSGFKLTSGNSADYLDQIAKMRDALEHIAKMGIQRINEASRSENDGGSDDRGRG